MIDLDRLAGWMDGLTDAAAALRHVADGKAIGKIVLDVSRTAGR